MTRQETTYRLIAGLVQARHNCLQRKPEPNTEWVGRHAALLRQIERELLPSGSGIDSGTTIDLDASNGEKLVFYTSFHHMDENGMYDGWTEHTIIVKASLLSEINIRITGRNRNDIKEYLYQTFEYCLTRPVVQAYDPETDRSTFDVLAEVNS